MTFDQFLSQLTGSQPSQPVVPPTGQIPSGSGSSAMNQQTVQLALILGAAVLVFGVFRK